MGVEAETIIMIGCNINHIEIEEEFKYQLLEKYSLYENSITYIDDGMSGNYLYVGKIIAYSEDMYAGFNVQIDYIPEHLKLEIKAHLFETLGIIEEPSLFVFNHIY